MNNEKIFTVYRYPKNGKLQYVYSALKNLVNEKGYISKFNTNEITYNLQNILDIECQRSYDDSVNLILNNGSEKPRLINSRFAKLTDDTYEFISRDQIIATNLYDVNKVDSQTDLFLRSSKWPKIRLSKVEDTGNLMGGNYCFYIKYADDDDNMSDIVSESGVVSIFHGTTPRNISGTLVDERVSKSIHLKIDNLDTSFSRFYLFYSRDTSDLNGISMTKYYKLTQHYDIVASSQEIVISGYENTLDIAESELNIIYNYYTNAKTQAITQNMLFLGNVETNDPKYSTLQQLSYHIQVSIEQKRESIGYVDGGYGASFFNTNDEYYDPLNIYNYLGYWPDEFYQLGVVYLLADGNKTMAFQLRGKVFDKIGDINYTFDEKSFLSDTFTINQIINEETFVNTGGVFKTPKVEIINHKEKTVKPLYFKMSIPEKVLENLKKLGVVGYFFVRTKRTPTNLFQGLSVGIEDTCGIPMINVEDEWICESFLNQKGNTDPSVIWNKKGEYIDDNTSDAYKLGYNFDAHKCVSRNTARYSGLLSIDVNTNLKLKGSILWSDFLLVPEYSCKIKSFTTNRQFIVDEYTINTNDGAKGLLVYVDEETPHFYIDNCHFSTSVGSKISPKEFGILGPNPSKEQTNDKLIRGNYCPIIGCDSLLETSTIYTVKLPNITNKQWINNLMVLNDIYYAISDRYSIDESITPLGELQISCFRGDCFTNTSTIRLNKNFIDNVLPTITEIIDENTWRKNYKGLNKTPEEVRDEKAKDLRSWAEINIGDLNTVPLGMWITYKHLSNYHTDLRSIDRTNVELLSLMGGESSFYPISGVNAKQKLPESWKLNDGLNVTLPRKMYSKYIPSPYENYHYENRIAFSNVSVTKMFNNGMRVFQGMAYQDIDRQYGAIVKLLPFKQNLLCVFEHGIGVIPINEKALLSTQEGLPIHLYGAGVLQEQVSVISDSVGSKWEDSIIKTDDGFFGVDSDTKQIWKITETEGLKIISDYAIRSFLNDNLSIDIHVDDLFIGVNNIKTHYNRSKGDVIFTFCHNERNWSICYSERLSMWTTRYSWIPLLSDNINSTLYSYDLKKCMTYLNILKQQKTNSDIKCEYPVKNKNLYNNGIKLTYENEFFDDVELRLIGICRDGHWSELEPWCKVVYQTVNGTKYFKGLNFNEGIQTITGDNVVKLFKDNYGQLIAENSEKLKEIDFSKYNCSQKWTSHSPINLDEKTFNLEPYLLYNTSFDEYEIDDKPVKCAVFKNTYKFDFGYIFSQEDEHILYLEDDVFGEDDYIFVKIEAVNRKNNQVLDTRELRILKNWDIVPQFKLYSHDITAPITKWYDKQEPFEFEFVINNTYGLQLIYDNLIILSNNVEPESLEYEIVGDDYSIEKNKLDEVNIENVFPVQHIADKQYYTTIVKDPVSGELHYKIHQDCLNINKYGRRLGNIDYLESKWNVVISPMFYKHGNDIRSARLRDKWLKVRIKYSGTDLTILNAIYTLTTISYV